MKKRIAIILMLVVACTPQFVYSEENEDRLFVTKINSRAFPTNCSLWKRVNPTPVNLNFTTASINFKVETLKHKIVTPEVSKIVPKSPVVSGCSRY